MASAGVRRANVRVRLNHTMHNRDLGTSCTIDRHVPYLDRAAGLRKEQQVAAVEAWLHTPTQHNHHRRLGIGEQRKAFPHRKRHSYHMQHLDHLKYLAPPWLAAHPLQKPREHDEVVTRTHGHVKNLH